LAERSHPVQPMPTKEECKRSAETCRHLARSFQTEAERQAFLKMAAQWDLLAGDVGEREGTRSA
jgi:hypothetical protein